MCIYIGFLPFQRSAGEFCLCPSRTAFIKPGVNTQACRARCRGENTSCAQIFPWKSIASCSPAGPTSCLEACCLFVSFLTVLHQGLPAVSKAAAVPAAPRGRQGKRQRHSVFAHTLMVQSEHAKSATKGKRSLRNLSSFSWLVGLLLYLLQGVREGAQVKAFCGAAATEGKLQDIKSPLALAPFLLSQAAQELSPDLIIESLSFVLTGSSLRQGQIV